MDQNAGYGQPWKLTYILDQPAKPIPAQVAFEHPSLQQEAENRRPTKGQIGQSEDDNVFVHHQANNLILSLDTAVDSPVAGCYFEQHQGDSHPKKHKEAMEMV